MRTLLLPRRPRLCRCPPPSSKSFARVTRFASATRARRNVPCASHMWILAAPGPKLAKPFTSCPALELQQARRNSPRAKLRTVPAKARIGKLPHRPQTLLLKPGDTLVLTRANTLGRPALYGKSGELLEPAQISVSIPQILDHAKVGDPVWFDDGKIGSVIRSVNPDTVSVEITQARPEGEKLAAEKGINLPETQIDIPALTDDDSAALPFIVEHADLVGCSFVRTEAHVRQLLDRIEQLGGQRLGLVLKIETRKAFENLPNLILAAMRTESLGIMIARGDLAVECGYQRLAEIQEEILWICEAAHVPVIWATQVLESLAKKGIPSRSEITDAAMGERAECVMLNKGPYAVLGRARPRRHPAAHAGAPGKETFDASTAPPRRVIFQ